MKSRLKSLFPLCLLLLTAVMSLAACKEAHKHTFGEWKQIKEPTCTEEGQAERSCTECKQLESKSIPAIGHTEIPLSSIAPTCIADGSAEGVACAVCGAVLSGGETIPATGHTFVDHFCSCGESDGTVSMGLEYLLTEDEQGYILCSFGSCYDADIKIPATYQGLPVVGIAASTFRRNISIISVTIPDSVSSIEARTFQECMSLRSVTLPTGLLRIERSTFEKCSSLEQIVIPDSVEQIADDAFASCTGLKSIHLGSGVAVIGNRAFSGCYALESITLPDSLTAMGQSAFENTGISRAVIGNGLARLDQSVFAYCRNLTEVVFGASMEEIGGSAFLSSESLSRIVIPDTVKIIGPEAFRYCRALTEIILPESVTELGAFAFSDCGALARVTLSTQLTSIGDFTFDQCYALTYIKMGSGITGFGTNSFCDCASLTAIDFGGTKAQWNAIEKASNWFFGWNYEIPTVTVTCTDGTVTEEPS